MTSIAIDRLDGLSSSTAIKGPCRVATTANITLSGLQTIDGVSLAAEDRVLVKNQTTASQNGIYVVDTGTWRRAADFTRNRDIRRGAIVVVTDGTVGAGPYRLATADPITLDTSSITFEEFEDFSEILSSLPETPEKYGASTSGTAAANATAFALLEATVPGAEIDMRGRSYPITAVPTGARYFNGGWQVGTDRPVSAPIRQRKHPLDGYPVTVRASTGISYHTGPIWYESTDNRLHMVFSMAVGHASAEGQIVVYTTSEDYGQTMGNWRTLFSKTTERVLSIAGGKTTGGNYHVVIFTEVDTYHYLSTDQGTTWTVSTISTPTYNHFGYGEILPWPASVGGSDTDGFIIFTYVGDRITQLRWNGSAWSEGLFFDGRSTGTARAGAAANEIRIATASGYNANWFKSAALFEDVNVTITGGTGSGQVKRVTSADLTTSTLTMVSNWTTPPDATSTYSIEGPNESAAVKVGDQYLVYVRGARNVMVCKTSDPRTAGTWYDTGIPNRGDSTVGDPLTAIYKDGNVYLYQFDRENWGAVAYEQNLVVYSQEAVSLLATNGVFSVPRPDRAMLLPSRGLGMLFVADTPAGMVGICRVGETVYPTDSTEAVVNQLMIISPVPVPAASPNLQFDPRENWFTDGSFSQARAQTISGMTGGEEVAPGIFYYASGSTGTAVISDIDASAARLLPPGLRWKINLDTTDGPSDYSGLAVYKRGRKWLQRIADSTVTWQIWGGGTTPAEIRCLIEVNYGGGGSATETTSVLCTLPPTDCDLWVATAKAQVDTIVGKTIGTDPYIRLTIDNFNQTDEWETDIYLIDLAPGSDVIFPTIPVVPPRLVVERDASSESAYLGGLLTGSGRFRIGNFADNDLEMRVSSDGSTWTTAMRIDDATGKPNLATKQLWGSFLGTPPIQYSSDVYVVAQHLLGSATTTGALTADRLYMTPISIPNVGQATRLGVWVTAGAVGNARCGIYANRSDGQGPAALLVDSGAIDTNGTGEATIDYTFPYEGVYWLALVSSSTPTVRISGGTSIGMGLNSSGQRFSYKYRAFTYAALPSDETAQSYTNLFNTNTPLVYFRKA
jgi:hypothetical protein